MRKGQDGGSSLLPSLSLLYDCTLSVFVSLYLQILKSGLNSSTGTSSLASPAKRGSDSGATNMVRTRNAVKRQKVATVESALFNPDVVFLLAGLLDARDLCEVSLTCKTLGGRQTEAYNGLSLVEEASRRMSECASVWERSCLRKYEDEGWIELCHHLQMLRSKLTFDQLVGTRIRWGDADKSIIRIDSRTWSQSSALCNKSCDEVRQALCGFHDNRRRWNHWRC